MEDICADEGIRTGLIFSLQKGNAKTVGLGYFSSKNAILTNLL